MKRVFDLAIVLLALPLVLPLALLVGLLIRIRLGAPIFFKQVRPGLAARPFVLFKFRTMRDVYDSEGKLLPDYERLTPLGGYLRKLSLDELPQLWNVLRGEMSLVGPRPLLMEYLPLYTSEQARRHDVKPGITGLAQVRGRNSIGWDEKFAMDVWYVDHQSIALDIKILAKTIRSVVRRDGVNRSDDVTMPRLDEHRR